MSLEDLRCDLGESQAVPFWVSFSSNTTRRGSSRGNFPKTEPLPLLPLFVGFRDGVTSGICPAKGPAESPQWAPNLHAGRLASPDKLCVRRKGAVKRHFCFSIPNSPRVPLFPIQTAPTPGVASRSNQEPHPAELTGSARPSKGPRSQRRRPSARRVAAMQRWQSCLTKPSPGADTSLRVGKDAISEGDPGVRSRGWRFSLLSGGRARPEPGPCGRSGGASSLGACAHRVRRAALRLP